MQEIRNEHFTIGRDSNPGFRALGRLQDVNTMAQTGAVYQQHWLF